MAQQFCFWEKLLHVYQVIQTGMFVAVLFTMPKSWNDLGASQGEGMNQMWHIHTMEYNMVKMNNCDMGGKKEWIIEE